MRLTTETTTRELKALTTPSRAAEERRHELERLASLCTDRTVDVAVDFDADRAFAREAERPGVDYEIRIPTAKYEQVQTELPPKRWDRRIQIAFLFHELGHVYYSDFDRFGDRRSAIPNRWRELFRAIYNAAEDGVIETQMANEFTVTDDFVLLNGAVAHKADEKHRRFVELFGEDVIDGRPVQTYTVFEGLVLGLLDRGFVDSGRFRALLDPEYPWRRVKDGRADVLRELEPELDEYMAAMLSEPNGRRRVELASEFYETARPNFESLPALQAQRLQTTVTRPPDVRAASGWRARAADRLPDEAVAERSIRRRSTRTDAELDDPRGQSASDTSDRNPPGSVGVDRFIRAANRVSPGRSRGRGTATKPLESEASRILDVVRDDAVDLAEVIVAAPADDGGDTGRWKAAVDRSKPLEADLRTQLRRERRPRERPGKRLGRLDTRRIVSATRGTQRIFTRKEAGTRKDYSCVLLLDRSGSMDGCSIEHAEIATAQLARALYAVGVDVSVLSLWRSRPCLELPFGAAPEEYTDRLVTGRATGSTPLSDGLRLARELASRGRGAVPFIIAITDGIPDNRSEYREQLSKCSAPVFGVYIGADRSVDTEYFDRIVYANPGSVDRSVDRLLRRLFTREA